MEVNCCNFLTIYFHVRSFSVQQLTGVRLKFNSRYCYENGNGVLKLINKSSKNKNKKSCLHDQQINKKNVATSSV